MTRPMFLSNSGWYPSDGITCKKEINSYIRRQIFFEGITPISAIVPHAGWYFSGVLSVNAIRLLKEKNGDINQIFIFGGHLSEINLPIIETFDVAETPFGTLENNKDVLQFAINNFNIQTMDFYQDNTIEILLPIIKYFFGNVKVTAIYLPPNIKIKSMIESLYDNFNHRALFIGSTDLTHYGDNYSFYYNGTDMEPIQWVKTVNDKRYVDMLLSMKSEDATLYATKNSSACSAGAAYAAMVVASKNKVQEGKLVGYYTSYDVHPDKSFVGYAGIVY